VMRRAMGRIHERDRTLVRRGAQLPEAVGMLGNFLPMAVAEAPDSVRDCLRTTFPIRCSARASSPIDPVSRRSCLVRVATIDQSVFECCRCVWFARTLASFAHVGSAYRRDRGFDELRRRESLATVVWITTVRDKIAPASMQVCALSYGPFWHDDGDLPLWRASQQSVHGIGSISARLSGANAVATRLQMSPSADEPRDPKRLDSRSPP
jgi:hypothetical protein